MQKTLNNREYYVERSEQERRIAGEAEDPSIRDIHLQMAKEYDLLAEEAAQILE